MFTKTPPPTDLLLSYPVTNSPQLIRLWPKQVVGNPGLIRQAMTRRELYASLAKFFDRIKDPAMDINEAITYKLIDPSDLASLYDDLADFFSIDKEHARLILYLPFELLPDRKFLVDWPESLATASAKFIGAYRASWERLLNESDCRANFVDGDVLEFEPGELLLPNVRKAAHLIPEMIRKGLISVADIVQILNKTEDLVLIYSILEVLPTLTDLGLFSETDWQELLSSSNPELDKSELIQYRNIKPNQQTSEAKAISVDQIKSLLYGTLDCLRMDFDRIGADCELNKVKTAPVGRVNWLIQERQSRCVEDYANLIADAFEKGMVSRYDIANLIFCEKDEIAITLAIISTRKIVEGLVRSDSKKAEAVAMVDFFKTIFSSPWFELWFKCLPIIKDQLAITLYHWLARGLVDYQYLKQFKLAVPQLASFSSDCQLIEENADELRPLLESVYSRPEVAKLLYPVFVFFGSRLKGYSLNLGSDLDLAILIRPDVSENDKPQIKNLLEEIHSHPKIRGRILEFWLENEDDRLKIKDMPTIGTLMADSSWAHILLYGLWCGEWKSINELYQKLLSTFFFPTNRIIGNLGARVARLRMMEMETLQYRLMHKGYWRYFPREGGIEAEHSWPLGPQSAFWDPGYRRVAAKLFIAKVFLPELR
jgi:hypothetical protein